MQNFSITWGKSWSVWLRSIIQYVWQTCGLFSGKGESTILYEDNSELFNWKSDIEIQMTYSCENLTNLFTKSLPKRT